MRSWDNFHQVLSLSCYPFLIYNVLLLIRYVTFILGFRCAVCYSIRKAEVSKAISGKATGNSRESRTPKIPRGNSREFLKFWRELRGIYGSFVFFPIFSERELKFRFAICRRRDELLVIVDYDNLMFNLTHCIMCTSHNRHAAF